LPNREKCPIWFGYHWRIHCLNVVLLQFTDTGGLNRIPSLKNRNNDCLVCLNVHFIFYVSSVRWFPTDDTILTRNLLLERRWNTRSSKNVVWPKSVSCQCDLRGGPEKERGRGMSPKIWTCVRTFPSKHSRLYQYCIVLHSYYSGILYRKRVALTRCAIIMCAYIKYI
jgi:hypothetical protein